MLPRGALTHYKKGAMLGKCEGMPLSSLVLKTLDAGGLRALLATNQRPSRSTALHSNGILSANSGFCSLPAGDSQFHVTWSDRKSASL